MPILSMFYGIIVRMYYTDNKQHQVPHILVEYGGDKAVFSIADGNYLQAISPITRPALCKHGLKSAAKN
jgi:hypothetical protein